jgi:hypothetical protein
MRIGEPARVEHVVQRRLELRRGGVEREVVKNSVEVDRRQAVDERFARDVGD